MDFFCQAIISGIPLRGCIATGTAIMDTEKSILFGKLIVEAACGETERDAIGICFGKSFKNSHPVYNDYFSNIKKYSKDSYVSPMMLDGEDIGEYLVILKITN